MKTLYESLLDDFDELDKDVHQSAKESVMNFLIDNYKLNSKPINPDTTAIKISDKSNKDGKYVVDIDGNLRVINLDINSLTNNIFVFGKVSGFFECCNCNNLTSLEGAPKKVGVAFYCVNCNNLTSLEGAPEKVGDNFSCFGCKTKFSKKDVEKVSNVKDKIECY